MEVIKQNIYGPWELELKVFIVSDDGSSSGVVTLGLGIGKNPGTMSADDLRARIEKAMREQVPSGYRTMNRRELLEHLAAEKYGQRIAVASPTEFDE